MAKICSSSQHVHNFDMKNDLITAYVKFE